MFVRSDSEAPAPEQLRPEVDSEDDSIDSEEQMMEIDDIVLQFEDFDDIVAIFGVSGISLIQISIVGSRLER